LSSSQTQKDPGALKDGLAVVLEGIVLGTRPLSETLVNVGPCIVCLGDNSASKWMDHDVGLDWVSKDENHVGSVVAGRFASAMCLYRQPSTLSAVNSRHAWRASRSILALVRVSGQSWHRYRRPLKISDIVDEVDNRASIARARIDDPRKVWETLTPTVRDVGPDRAFTSRPHTFQPPRKDGRSILGSMPARPKTGPEHSHWQLPVDPREKRGHRCCRERGHQCRTSPSWASLA
jgi:hypothetical protein